MEKNQGEISTHPLSTATDYNLNKSSSTNDEGEGPMIDNKNAYLFWYKQEVNDFPKFMLWCNTFGSRDYAAEFPKEKFDAQINNTSVPLKIQKLQPSDSALYYCAVRPTVTGNTQSLYKNLWRTLKTGGTIRKHKGLNSDRKLQKDQGTSTGKSE
uniref:Immunoglobulin V-set domain-containing protein n=1 Tax=Myripristis murdjan TaxID=586833 RepID=A0A667WD56_9TELE